MLLVTGGGAWIADLIGNHLMQEMEEDAPRRHHEWLEAQEGDSSNTDTHIPFDITPQPRAVIQEDQLVGTWTHQSITENPANDSAQGSISTLVSRTYYEDGSYASQTLVIMGTAPNEQRLIWDESGVYRVEGTQLVHEIDSYVVRGHTESEREIAEGLNRDRKRNPGDVLRAEIVSVTETTLTLRALASDGGMLVVLNKQ